MEEEHVEPQASPSRPTPIRELVKTIAGQLGERTPQVQPKLRRMVKVMGPEQTLTFVQRALEIEASGGMMLPDQSRKRTVGGIFFHLVQTQGPEELRRTPASSQEGENAAPRPAPPAPPVGPPLTWKERVPLIKELLTEKGSINAVKITVTGRPGKIKTTGTCIITTMQSTKAPSLPKGMPVPPTVSTTYTVYIALKQWRKVEESIKEPEDVLIIEGFPVLDAQTNSIAVFASSTTSKLVQAAQRQAQKAEA